MARRLTDLGEHGWIRRLLPHLAQSRRVLVGPGDDAAVVRADRHPLVLTTDTLVEGRHFRAGWETPSALGRRALRVNLSDVAAMGAAPVAALVSLAAPPALDAAVADGVMRGLAADAARHGVDVVGGNLVAARELAIGVALVGEARGPVLRRAGARPGDGLWVTGTLGGSGAAVRALLAGRRVRRPPVPVRLAAGVALARIAHAGIDVSDGLVQDLGHVCRAGGVAAEVRLDALPVAPACRAALGAGAARFAATAGEDHELLVAVPPSAEARMPALARRLGCRLTRIGRIAAGRPAVRLCDAAGRVVALDAGGFDHFR